MNKGHIINYKGGGGTYGLGHCVIAVNGGPLAPGSHLVSRGGPASDPGLIAGAVYMGRPGADCADCINGNYGI